LFQSNWEEVRKVIALPSRDWQRAAEASVSRNAPLRGPTYPTLHLFQGGTCVREPFVALLGELSWWLAGQGRSHVPLP
jgi:hypothetical protein